MWSGSGERDGSRCAPSRSARLPAWAGTVNRAATGSTASHPRDRGSRPGRPMRPAGSSVCGAFRQGHLHPRGPGPRHGACPGDGACLGDTGPGLGAWAGAFAPTSESDMASLCASFVWAGLELAVTVPAVGSTRPSLARSARVLSANVCQIRAECWQVSAIVLAVLCQAPAGNGR